MAGCSVTTHLRVRLDWPSNAASKFSATPTETSAPPSLDSAPDDAVLPADDELQATPDPTSATAAPSAPARTNTFAPNLIIDCRLSPVSPLARTSVERADEVVFVHRVVGRDHRSRQDAHLAGEDFVLEREDVVAGVVDVALPLDRVRGVDDERAGRAARRLRGAIGHRVVRVR